MIEQKLQEVEFKEKIKNKILKNIRINKKSCWIWLKSKHSYGYGKLGGSFNNKKWHLSVPRASWIIFKGDIPSNMIICHNCPNGDNPQCCNPDHMFLGTSRENTRDMMKKKRVFDFVGEKNNMAILKKNMVLKMRKLKNLGWSVKEISEKFNIKYYTCLDAISGRNWSHI